MLCCWIRKKWIKRFFTFYIFYLSQNDLWEGEKQRRKKDSSKVLPFHLNHLTWKKKKPGFVESSDSVLELETNAVPESFTNGFCMIVYKRNIALSGLLVCRLIKSLSEVLSSKLSRSPSKLRFSVEFFIFRTLFQPKTLSVHIPAAWWDLFTKYVNIHMFVSDSFSSIKEGVVQVTDPVG